MWRTIPTDPGGRPAVPASSEPTAAVAEGPAVGSASETLPAPGTVEVPELAGMSSHDARRTARLSDLQLVLEERPAGNALRSRVLWQEPEPGARVQPGQTILAVVGGRPGVHVPELHGTDEHDALETLRASGLVPSRRVERRSKSVGQGQVVRTRPRAGTEVPLGTRITYVVAAPPRPSHSAMRREARRSRSRGLPDASLLSMPLDE